MPSYPECVQLFLAIFSDFMLWQYSDNAWQEASQVWALCHSNDVPDLPCTFAPLGSDILPASASRQSLVHAGATGVLFVCYYVPTINHYLIWIGR